MREELQIFENEKFGAIRTLVLDGEVWFVGKDVAEALGYIDTNKAVAMHVDDDDKLNDKTALSLGQRGGWLINESGLYSLILSSKLPKAKEFKRWVTSEVLPSIRKHGGYINGQEKMNDKELLSSALILANKVIEEKDNKLRELQPKGEYYDNIVDGELYMNLRNTAHLVGVPEGVFVLTLLKKKYLYRDQKGILMPYANRKDIFEVREWYKPEIKKGGVQTLVKPEGRFALLKLFEKLGGYEM